MTNERLIVSTSFRGLLKRQIWDSARPLQLCRPERWTLESLGGKIRLTAPDGSRKLEFARQLNGEPIQAELTPGLSVRIQPVHALTPAFLEPSDKRALGSDSSSVVAYAGIGKQLNSCVFMNYAYVAYSRTRPVFLVKMNGPTASVKALLPGVDLVVGFKATALAVGRSHEVELLELLDATFKWGANWWTLRRVNRPLGVVGVEDSELREPDNRWFRNVMVATTGLLAVGLAALIAMKSPTPKKPVETVSIQLQPKAVVLPKSAIQAIMAPKPLPVTPAESLPAVPLSAHLPPPPTAARNPVKSSLAGNRPALASKPYTQNVNPSAGLRTLQNPSARILAQKQQLLQSALGDVVAAIKAGGAGMSGAGGGGGGGGGGMPAVPGGVVSGFGAARGAGQGLALPGRGGSAAGFFEGSAVGLTPTTIRPSAVAVPQTKITRMQDYAASHESVAGALPGFGSGGGVGPGQGGGVGGVAAGVEGQGYSFVGLEGAEARVEEGLTKSEVDSVIRAHMSKIRFCHESAAVYRSDLDGKVVIAFTIGANGVVVRPNVQSSTISDPRLEQCIVGTLASLRFQKPRGKVTVSVSYPFVFKTLGRPE